MLTILEFAVAINKSERQVRRYIRQGRLEVVETDTGQKIPSEQVSLWTEQARPTPGVFEKSQAHVEHEAWPTPGSGPAEARLEPGALQEPLLRALELASQTLERAERLEARLLAAELRADRESRRAESLTTELGSYQRVLSEQAESLAEARARYVAMELAAAAQLMDHQAEPKIDATRSAPRGWGSRIKGMLFRKIG